MFLFNTVKSVKKNLNAVLGLVLSMPVGDHNHSVVSPWLGHEQKTQHSRLVISIKNDKNHRMEPFKSVMKWLWSFLIAHGQTMTGAYNLEGGLVVVIHILHGQPIAISSMVHEPVATAHII